MEKSHSNCLFFYNSLSIYNLLSATNHLCTWFSPFYLLEKHILRFKAEIISKSISMITQYWTLTEYLGLARYLPAKPAHDIHLTFNIELLSILSYRWSQPYSTWIKTTNVNVYNFMHSYIYFRWCFGAHKTLARWERSQEWSFDETFHG